MKVIMKIGLFLVCNFLVVYIHIVQGEFIGIAIATVNYTGETQGACPSSNCAYSTSYFPYYDCNNGNFDWEGRSQSFWDPVPDGYAAQQFNITLYGSYGCQTLEANSIAVLIDAVFVQFINTTPREFAF